MLGNNVRYREFYQTSVRSYHHHHHTQTFWKWIPLPYFIKPEFCASLTSLTYSTHLPDLLLTWLAQLNLGADKILVSQFLISCWAWLLRMRLLLLLLSLAFCCGFTVTDLLNPENAEDRQFDVEDQILPVFLITFIGALLNNILNFGGQETNVQGISFIYILLLSCFIHWFANVFIAVLIIGGYGSSLPRSETTRMSAEIYIPSTGRSCILPSLPVLGYIFSILCLTK